MKTDASRRARPQRRRQPDRTHSHRKVVGLFSAGQPTPLLPSPSDQRLWVGIARRPLCLGACTSPYLHCFSVGPPRVRGSQLAARGPSLACLRESKKVTSLASSSPRLPGYRGGTLLTTWTGLSTPTLRAPPSTCPSQQRGGGWGAGGRDGEGFALAVLWDSPSGGRRRRRRP